MRAEVIYSGRASVHHNRETNASRAAQFCSWGFLNIFTSAADNKWHHGGDNSAKYAFLRAHAVPAGHAEHPAHSNADSGFPDINLGFRISGFRFYLGFGVC